jgi:hypothetical protein
MAEHKSRTVVLDGKFVRHEAAEAVRTFFRPVIGTYNLVRDASNPGKPIGKPEKASGEKGGRR